MANLISTNFRVENDIYANLVQSNISDTIYDQIIPQKTLATPTTYVGEIGYDVAANQVIVSNGTTWSVVGGGGAGIISILGNTGSVSGTTITITTGILNANGTINFTGNGVSTLTFNSVDANNNVGLGTSSLAAITTGTDNVSLGAFSSQFLTTGSNNVTLGFNTLTDSLSTTSTVAIGSGSLTSLGGGTRNIAVGFSSGSNYTGNESSNILIGSSGTLGESNALRLGQATGVGTGQSNTCYLQGVYSNTSVTTNTKYVTINDANGQLGVTPLFVTPAIYSRAAGSQSVGGTATLTSYDTTISASPSFSITTGLYTVAVAGIYSVTGKFSWSATTIGDIVNLYISQNATNTAVQTYLLGFDGPYTISQSGSLMLNCSIGDTISIAASYAGAAGPKNISLYEIGIEQIA